MTAAVLTKGNVAVNQRGLHRRKLGGPKVCLAQQFVHGPSADRAQEHALCIDPRALHVLRTAADEHRPGGAESNQLMRIHGQIFRSEGTRVLKKIAGHPVILGGRSKIFHLLAEFTSENFGASFTRGSNKGNRQTRLVRHGDQGGLSVTREAFNAHLFGVNGFVGLEIVERTARAPSPRPERTPVVQLARLPLVDQTNDSLR